MSEMIMNRVRDINMYIWEEEGAQKWDEGSELDGERHQMVHELEEGQ